MTTEPRAETRQFLTSGGINVLPRYVGLMMLIVPISLFSTAIAAFFVTVTFVPTGSPLAEFTILVIFGYAIVISHYTILDDSATEPREFGIVVGTIKTILIMGYFHAAIAVGVFLSYSVYLAGYPTAALFVALWYPGYEVVTARKSIPLNVLMGYTMLDWIVETVADRSSEFSLDEWKQRYEEATTTISHTTLRFSGPRRTSTN